MVNIFFDYKVMVQGCIDKSLVTNEKRNVYLNIERM